MTAGATTRWSFIAAATLPVFRVAIIAEYRSHTELAGGNREFESAVKTRLLQAQTSIDCDADVDGV